VEGFVCSYLRGGYDLILCDPHSSDEAWLWASRLDKSTIKQLVMHEARVQRAAATQQAALRIDFDDGFSLVNPPKENVEAWELRGPGSVLLVGTPGGGPPAVWDESSEIRVIDPGAEPLPAQVAQMFDSWPTLPGPAGTFQFRATARGREAIELHAPDSPAVNRSGIIRFVLPDNRWAGGPDLSTGGPYMRYTNPEMQYVNPRTGDAQ
jgi:Family of unknown function (DUF6188)